MRIIRHLFSWGLAALLIGLFLHLSVHPWPNPPAGQVLLFDLPGENILFSTLAERSGYPIFEPGFRVVIGGLMLLISLLIFLPPTRRTGGFLAFLLMTSAIVAHMSPWLGQELPLELTSGDAGRTDDGRQFALAIALLVASILLLVVHPSKQER